MNLFFLRHGIAVDPGEDGLPKRAKDAERPLSGPGKKRIWRVAEAMLAMELKFDVVLSSPLLRATQTAEIVSEALELRRKLVLTDHLSPEGSPASLIVQIRALASCHENILLVGHEPYFSQLIARLVTDRSQAQIELRKGGLARLKVENKLRYAQCATLAWLLTPKQLGLMV